PHPLISRLDLAEDAVADVFYETTVVRGPLRVGGKVVDDNLGGDDVQVRMRRINDSTRWTWGFPGGTPDFYMRIPTGEYEMSFIILQDAIPDTAWGDAPLGYHLPVNSPYVAPTGRN